MRQKNETKFFAIRKNKNTTQKHKNTKKTTWRFVFVFPMKKTQKKKCLAPTATFHRNSTPLPSPAASSSSPPTLTRARLATVAGGIQSAPTWAPAAAANVKRGVQQKKKQSMHANGEQTHKAHKWEPSLLLILRLLLFLLLLLLLLLLSLLYYYCFSMQKEKKKVCFFCLHTTTAYDKRKNVLFCFVLFCFVSFCSRFVLLYAPKAAND